MPVVTNLWTSDTRRFWGSLKRRVVIRLFHETRELTYISSTSCFSSRPLLSSVTFCSNRSRWPIACWYCGFESHQGYERVSLVIVVFCQAEVSATDRSLIQRSPTDCAMFECDREASILRRPWPPRGLLGQARKVPIAVIWNVNLITAVLRL